MGIGSRTAAVAVVLVNTAVVLGDGAVAAARARPAAVHDSGRSGVHDSGRSAAQDPGPPEGRGHWSSEGGDHRSSAARFSRPSEARGFADEFSGPEGSEPDPSRWEQLTGCLWGYRAERQCYTSGGRNARLDGDGHLVINARRETYTGDHGVRRKYTSARLVSRLASGSGSVQVRAKVSGWQRGAWPAIWLHADPLRRQRHYGEIDLMENGLNGARWKPEYHVHTDRFSGGGAYDVDATRWHVYKVTWTTGPSGRARFYVDGRFVRSFPYRVPARSSARLILNVAVGSQAGRPAADLDSTLTVDYVRTGGRAAGR
ncbi:glycoside hydrolase family 16 protein [Planomonospora sp. ID91781]|uniref:glycoside hydrolase family 16 protein n=1 Tax=Planomonospora sp. ID91781 TaxID=2738135 RepID=UPI0018C40AFD|nr:glycoside hydrolase family 16 protein [Planomonospora sp. ID91781]MBG0821476.1 glycoside hydrolase family 16 protein [Planomonospora sp. ID91781]